MRRRKKMNHKFVCASDGEKGGLIMFWRKEMKIHRLELDPMYIDVLIEGRNNTNWRLTGMYGELKLEHK